MNQPYSMPAKIYTTRCPCCKNNDTLDCNEVGFKGSKWKWEGSKNGSVAEEKSGEWAGSQVKHELLNISGWAYFELIHCE